MLKLSHFVTVDTPDGRWGVFWYRLHLVAEND